MAGFDHSVLTDVGWDALVDAEAGSHIEYVTFEAGDGYVYGGDAEMFAMTNLKNKIMNFPITNFSNDGDGQLTLLGVISSANVTTGFYLREIGVRATIDGGPPLLYAVANAGAEADYMPSSAEGTVIQTIQIIIKIDRASNVTVVVTPGLDVTAQNIGPGSAGAGWFRDKSSQILWFKRFKSPRNTVEITETSDLISIDIPTVIENDNLDMWVAIGNPDIFPNFSTIQNALNYLIPRQIRPGATSTITVMPGVWPTQPTTVINHPQSPQIRIIGTAGATKTITGVSGSKNAVVLTGAANSMTDMNVGDYFLYKNTSSNTGKAISGCWKVTAKTSSSITFDSAFKGTFPSLGGVSGGTVVPLQSVYPIQAHKSGFEFNGLGLGLMRYICVLGNGSSMGGGEAMKAVAGISNIENCGVHQWYDTASCAGFDAQLSGRLNCLDCCASRGNTGFQAGWGGVEELNNCFASSNEYAGIRAEGGYQRLFGAYACGNGSYGFVVANNGTGLIGGVLANNNLGHGMSALYNSSITSSGATNSFSGNGDDDCSLHVSSTILRTAGPAISYGSSNIATNLLSSDGCWFQP